MNVQVRDTAKLKRLDTKRAVEWVVLELPLQEPLDGTPQKILDAFEALLESCRSPRTSHIAERIGKSNETSVRKHLQDLVSSGYIGAYRKKGQWRWCDRETAARMIQSDPSYKRDFEDLTVRADGQKF